MMKRWTPKARFFVEPKTNLPIVMSLMACVVTSKVKEGHLNGFESQQCHFFCWDTRFKEVVHSIEPIIMTLANGICFIIVCV